MWSRRHGRDAALEVNEDERRRPGVEREFWHC
jgi:hypothetical protein